MSVMQGAVDATCDARHIGCKVCATCLSSEGISLWVSTAMGIDLEVATWRLVTLVATWR